MRGGVCSRGGTSEVRAVVSVMTCVANGENDGDVGGDSFSPPSPLLPLLSSHTLWTVLRSPHVHKKSQENFERKVHERAIKAWDADADVVDQWCRYLRQHAWAGGDAGDEVAKDAGWDWEAGVGVV